MTDRQLPGSKRRQTLRDYNHECHICGSDSELRVHHINGDASNHDIENLLAVCHDCHMKIHHHPDEAEVYKKWNEKILPDEDRKGPHQLHIRSGDYSKFGVICDNCGVEGEIRGVLTHCPECGEYDSLSLK